MHPTEWAKTSSGRKEATAIRKYRRQVKERREGYIYFIQAEEFDGEDEPSGLVKIGFTLKSPTRRLSSLQTCSPLRLVLRFYLKGPQSQEFDLHKKFAQCHHRGEWFRPHKEMPHVFYKGTFTDSWLETKPIDWAVEKLQKG